MFCTFGLLFGRIFLSIIFILSGLGKFLNYNETAQFMAAKGFTMVPLFLIGAAIVELAGGISLFLGYRARWGGLLLFLYLIPVTLIFHDFWEFSGIEREMQRTNFLKNLAIMGGLLYVACIGSGKCSVDVGSCKLKS